MSLIYSKRKRVFFSCLFPTFFSEVVGHLGDSRVILVKADGVFSRFVVDRYGSWGMQKSFCPK